jgi:hypothetical protein
VLVTTQSRLPDSHRELERYVVLPSIDRATFLAPLHAGRSAASATLRAYGGLRLRRRQLSRNLLAAAIDVGLAGHPVGTVLRVLVERSLDPAELTAVSPVARFAEALGSTPLIAAFGVPPYRPNAKPTLQLFTATGRPAGYAKLSWSNSTRLQIRREAAAADRLGSSLSKVRMPQLIGTPTWREFDVVVTEPLPADVRSWDLHAAPPPIELNAEIAAVEGIQDVPLGASEMFRRLEADAGLMGGAGSDLSQAFTAACEAVRQRHGQQVLRFGRWHGDWVPWNIARSGGSIYAWDWEHSAPRVPLGLDLLHWYFQLAFIWRQGELAASFAESARLARQSVATLQGDDASAAACTAMYTLELVARYSGQFEDDGLWPPRFFPEVLETLNEIRGG